MSSNSEDRLDYHHGMESRHHHHHHHHHSHHPYSYVNSMEVSKTKIWRVRPRAKGSEALTLMTLTWTGRPPSPSGPPVQLPSPPPLQQPNIGSVADVTDCTCNCLCSLGPTQESAASVAKQQFTSSSNSNSSNSAMTVTRPTSGTFDTVMDIPDGVPDAHTGASIVLVVLWITYCHLFGSPTLS